MQNGYQRAPGRTSWAFLTNHFEVLLCIHHDPGIRLRDVALSVGITERAAQAIVADLVAAGYLTRRRVGRRNQYEIHLEQPLRQSRGLSHSIGDLLGALARLEAVRHDGERLAAAKAGPEAHTATTAATTAATAVGSPDGNGHHVV